MISSFWTDTSAYYALRRRLPKEAPEPKPAGRPLSKMTLAVLAYAAAHDGLVNTLAAERELGRPEPSLRACLRRMGAVNVGPHTYKVEAR